MTEPQCIPLQHITGEQVGGKASGLSKLVKIGLDVPDGFVVVGATPDNLPDGLNDAYAKLNNQTVAVRSSAIGEDSHEASFAGQYETILNVRGATAVRNAVVQCLTSLENKRATAYRQEHTNDVNVRMCVVVQEMVDARTAGVLFTVDPVTARRDLIVIDAIEGLGEALVGGHATPDHFVFSRDGELRKQDLRSNEAILNHTQLQALLAGALQAESAYGEPIDMEWAFDQEGRLRWLQARPVTNLPADLNELDVSGDPSHVYTWCNIGEMMPGAVAPLTYSVTGRGIDIGMQRMYRQFGTDIPADEQPRYVAMHYNHFFLNLTELAQLSAQVAGSTKEQMCLALCGRDVQEVAEPKPISKPRRFVNGLRYARMLSTAGNRATHLRRLINSIRFEENGDARELYASIDRELPKVWTAYEHHLISSSKSGAVAPIMVRTLAGDDAPTQAHHAQVAEWLAGAADVESADIAAGAERILDRLYEADARAFMDLTAESGHQWLVADAPIEVRQEYGSYLDKHGHRAVRELELRQKEWAADPTPLVTSLQSGLRGRFSGIKRPSHAKPAQSQRTSSRRLRMLLSMAHTAVRQRECTKSLLVQTTVRFKQAYRTLGAAMVREGLLPDADLVFFLLHDELGRCLQGETDLVQMANARREAIDYQMPLRFEQVFVGPATPADPPPVQADGSSLVGKPVSRGVVSGRARVVLSLEQAATLQAGEILIAPITDVGWTPYFSLVAGLACDVGSAVSHGAVVAREYGLPAVVDLRTATSSFRTGDVVVLDGDQGVLKLAESD